MKNLSSKIKPLFEKEKDIVFVYLFGSRARKISTPFSDIDIAVFLKRKKGPYYKLRLLERLYSLLETNNVDLVILNETNLPLQYRILRDGKLVVDKDPLLRHKFFSLTLRKYHDFAIKEEQIFNRRFYGR